MNKKSLAIIFIAVVLIGAGWGVHFLTSKSSEDSTTQTPNSKTQIVNVDDVVNDPEKYIGVIGVEGTIAKVDETNSVFTLGCEDVCILMPVKFNGLVPKEGTNVIAYGEVKKIEDKYIFVAQEIGTR